MAKRLSDKVRELSLGKGYHLSKRISSNQVDELIRNLRPRYPQKKLIRLGADHDGGYLIPDDLEGITTCFSPGVSDEASFEEALLERGISSHLCDYSVEKPPLDLPGCTFEKKFLGTVNDDQFTTLASWMDLHSSGSDEPDLMLQMDIEGFEYAIFLETPAEYLRKFRVMIVEFHDLFDLFHPFSYNVIKLTFDKLLELFDVAHIHPNGYGQSVVVDGKEYPRIVEMTLIRKDRNTEPQTSQFTYPHSLDRPCVPGGEELVLPRHWYTS